jgi:hypothetical protein
MLSLLFIRRFTSSLKRIGVAQRGGALLVALLLSSLLAAAATVTSLTATFDSSNVRVEWEVNTEADVTGFDIYRKSATDPTYTLLGNIIPTGQRRYLYTDRNVYRGVAGGGNGPFTYRLTVRGGGDQSYTTTLAQTPSAVQRSWGTIKSMFR